MSTFSRLPTNKPIAETSSRYLAIFISDIRPGFAVTNAAYSLGFLRSVACETLYLVGDMVDIW